MRDIVGDGEYFQAILPDGTHLVAPVPAGVRLPMGLGRDVLAELAGQPERAEWKRAVMADAAAEAAAAAAFKELFGPYDIMG